MCCLLLILVGREQRIREHSCRAFPSLRAKRKSTSAVLPAPYGPSPSPLCPQRREGRQSFFLGLFFNKVQSAQLCGSLKNRPIKTPFIEIQGDAQKRDLVK